MPRPEKTGTEALRRQLDAQAWRCVMADCALGGTIRQGDKLARCYDGVGLAHVECVVVGRAPAPPPATA